MRRVVLIAVALAGASACGTNPAGTAVAMPGGEDGIGFDDLRFSASFASVLVPAGRTGNLDLVDPDTLAVTSIGGFGATDEYDGSHDDGPTSVDQGAGLLFVTDRTTLLVQAVDPIAKTFVASAALSGTPGYVRFVEATNEIWITEPDDERIEVFGIGGTDKVELTRKGFLGVAGGPEAIVVDPARGRVYAALFHRKTVVIDVASRALVATWLSGCDASSGLALDDARGLLFAACKEGEINVLAVDRDGLILSDYAEGAGVDVIGYNPTLSHLYIAGGASETLGIVAVSTAGGLSLLGQFDTVDGASCATADDRGHAWVCAPDEGNLLRIDDPFPPSR